MTTATLPCPSESNDSSHALTIFKPGTELAQAFEPPPGLGGRDSLRGWVALYWQVHVAHAPPKTMAAKRQDLSRFLRFFARAVQHDHIDGWTPAVSRAFQAAMHESVSGKTGKPLAATTVNRVLATLRTFARWVHTQRPLLAGPAFWGVKDRDVEAPAWNGLTDWQLMRLKSAVDMRKKACSRGDQAPLLEAAIFYTLLNTGLREHELVSLDIADYHHRGFHDVRRKGARVTKKVPVPLEAREALDVYIKDCRGDAPGPLFMAPREQTRLTTRGAAYACERLSAQACAHIKGTTEHFKLKPHMLRHTFLKRIADKHGVHVAQQMSGNVNMREIFRYTKPSDAEMLEKAEGVFL
jgi:integrase/recombinase XerD